MSLIQNSETGLELGWGLILTIVGIALIAIAALQRAGQALGCVIYIAGFATSGGGITLVWKDLLNSAGFPGEAPSKSPGRYLGAFRLNGYHIQAYERQRIEDSGRSWRWRFPWFNTEPIQDLSDLKPTGGGVKAGGARNLHASAFLTSRNT